MKDLQAKHKEWCDKNFPPKASPITADCMLEVGSVSVAVGLLAHHALKSYQGIRGDFSDHIKGFEQAKRMGISRMAYMDGPERDVTGFRAPERILPLVGIIEEVGELANASLYAGEKDEQVDAVGDIVLYLIDYCNKSGIDFEDAVRTTAAKVHARDWAANQVNGEVPE